MKKIRQRHLFAKFGRSKRALALPLTFLILSVTTLVLISITYYFAVERVNARSQDLKISTSKQSFLSFDEELMSIVWQPGSARTVELADSGGKLCVQPLNNSVSISVSDGSDVNATVFSQNTGCIIYELPYAETADTGLYLKGDSRTVTNQSGALITQLFIRSGAEHAEILLRYRPTVSYAVIGTENDKPINTVRIYVVNLNSSDSFALYGKIPLKVSCVSTQVSTTTFNLDYTPETFQVSCILDETSGHTLVPISGSAEGTVINVEVVECSVCIERCIM